ncbi:hypothetical protein UA32_12310 [Photobacterium angustum]|uniref:Type IV toxin-antitoxin system AbiEi family antitoxin domain-containing protein n=1 Tax=Photobacterium angustum TaxID=661 RepID=A0ABX5GYE8_PHOAN|nr:DUF6088 family protein [Photobacterium angustum]KJG37734.1 hypothetical protein UA32_12310 [Photobacterium angustum]PSX03931.1 hypothetical protein C0W27_20770 [Photobacterium angustum]
MSTQAKIENRIKHIQKGLPFSINSFYESGSKASVQQSFSRLAKKGAITRLEKGIYCRPKPLKSIPSIKTVASAEDVARLWARQNGYKLVSQGQEEAYRLGLQTQAPIITLYWTNGPSRVFTVGKQQVKVIHVNSELLSWGNAPEGRLLRALSVFRHYDLPAEKLNIAFSRLSISNSEGKQLLSKLTNRFQNNNVLPELNL